MFFNKLEFLKFDGKDKKKNASNKLLDRKFALYD
jgi:hypothetical protein